MPERIIIFGSGGHAKVVLEAVAPHYPADGIAVLDDAPDAAARTLLGLPVRGSRAWMDAALGWEGAEIALGIGANAVRAELLAWLAARGRTAATIVHARATVSSSAILGVGCFLAAGAVVNAEAELGDGVIVNTGASVDHDCRLEAAVHIAPGVRLCGNVRIGARALVGAGSSVIPGVRIGSDALVGAGSVVIADVSDGARVAGNPARLL